MTAAILTRRGGGRAAITTLVVGGVMVVTSCFGPSATVADPGPSCPLAMALMCKFLPIAPDLEDDVDLTQPSAGETPPISPPLESGTVGAEVATAP